MLGYYFDLGLRSLRRNAVLTLLLVTAIAVGIGASMTTLTVFRAMSGIRRALGATRQAILRYFQLENLLIAGAGAALGVGCALGLNLWMVRNFEAVRLDNSRALVGALIMGLGQLAVLYPALRAAAISPALATRGG